MALATDAAMEVGLRRSPQLLVATSAAGPAVYGVSRPTIVIPHRLLTPDNTRCGNTGVCTLSLLNGGMQPDEEIVANAMDYLRKIKPSMTYSTSLQTLVFCAADAQAERKLIQRNVEWLVRMQKVAGPFAGAWGYPQLNGDNSNTAFAVWALYEADRAGVPAGVVVWRRTLDYWLKNQNADGSWGYKPGLAGTGTPRHRPGAAALNGGEVMSAAGKKSSCDFARNPSGQGSFACGSRPKRLIRRKNTSLSIW